MSFHLRVTHRGLSFQIYGAVGTNGKLYFHAGDIANILRCANVPGWVQKVASCQLGEVYPHADFIMRTRWVIEYNALLNLLEKMGPLGLELHTLLAYGSVVHAPAPNLLQPVTSPLHTAASQAAHPGTQGTPPLQGNPGPTFQVLSRDPAKRSSPEKREPAKRSCPAPEMSKPAPPPSLPAKPPPTEQPRSLFSPLVIAAMEAAAPECLEKGPTPSAPHAVPIRDSKLFTSWIRDRKQKTVPPSSPY